MTTRPSAAQLRMLRDLRDGRNLWLGRRAVDVTRPLGVCLDRGWVRLGSDGRPHLTDCGRMTGMDEDNRAAVLRYVGRAATALPGTARKERGAP